MCFILKLSLIYHILDMAWKNTLLFPTLTTTLALMCKTCMCLCVCCVEACIGLRECACVLVCGEKEAVCVNYRWGSGGDGQLKRRGSRDLTLDLLDPLVGPKHTTNTVRTNYRSFNSRVISTNHVISFLYTCVVFIPVKSVCVHFKKMCFDFT